MATSYQLHILLTKNIELQVGALGKFRFPAGRYIYTGSAKRNLQARIKRHLSKEKKLRWHIDYLLQQPSVSICEVVTSNREECAWNQSVKGSIPIAGFGSSDCSSGCGAHLRYLGESNKSKCS